MATRVKKAAKPATGEVAYSLVLRCCRSDMTSRNGFVWPDVGGIATAPDWKDDNECGHGLHGWLYGQGDHTTCDYWTAADAKWIVVRVADSDIRMLGGKCKFHSGVVVFVGTKSDAANYIIANEPRSASVAVIGLVREVGDNGVAEGGALATLTGGDRATLTGGARATLTGGDRATLTGGDGATLTGGDRATLTGGDRATLTGGDRATLTGGYGATLTGGYGATLTGGDRATLTGGARATLTGGDGATLTGGYGATLTGGDRATLTGGARATLTGGDRATLTGGDRATLTGGDGATLTGGARAELRFQHWDSKAERYRTKLAYVGEDGIEANVAYRLDDSGEVVKVQS